MLKILSLERKNQKKCFEGKIAQPYKSAGPASPPFFAVVSGFAQARPGQARPAQATPPKLENTDLRKKLPALQMAWLPE